MSVRVRVAAPNCESSKDTYELFAVARRHGINHGGSRALANRVAMGDIWGVWVPDRTARDFVIAVEKLGFNTAIGRPAGKSEQNSRV